MVAAYGGYLRHILSGLQRVELLPGAEEGRTLVGGNHLPGIRQLLHSGMLQQ